MQLLKICSIILLSLGLYACKKEIKDSVEYREVMAIHDEVMPEIAKLQDIKRELKGYADSLNIDKIRMAASEIVQADDAMMNWMSNFKLPEGKSDAEAYLKNEKVKIQDVADKINSAKATAQKILDELKAAKGNN